MPEPAKPESSQQPEKEEKPEQREPSPGESFAQDPYVERLRSDPSRPPPEAVEFEGLAGNSDRDGWARLYFNRLLTYYAEFRREDVLFVEPIPPEQSAIPGLKTTRVALRRDAVLEYTRATRARQVDEFDLDVRLGPVAPGPFTEMLASGTCNIRLCPGIVPVTRGPGPCLSEGPTFCRGFTCLHTCDEATCDTCRNTCRC